MIEFIESCRRVAWELRAEGKDCCAQRLEQMAARLTELEGPPEPTGTVGQVWEPSWAG